MVYVDHDYIDKIWDGLSFQERKYRESFFTWILFNLEILKKWAGVDTLEGRIQRLIDGRKVWEYCPELKFEYKRLCNYVSVVKERNKNLQDMLECYG